jgi:hypothetical protein
MADEHPQDEALPQDERDPRLEPLSGDYAPEQLDGEPEGELIEALAVIENVRTIEPIRTARPAIIQAAAVAATGFVAGAATAAALNRRRTRQPLLPTRAPGRLPGPYAELGPTRTFLVHVQTLRRP